MVLVIVVLDNDEVRGRVRKMEKGEKLFEKEFRARLCVSFFHSN